MDSFFKKVGQTYTKGSAIQEYTKFWHFPGNFR